MHNHCFSHAGDMTYGVPKLLVNYVKAGNLSDYYNAQSLAATIPTAIGDTIVLSPLQKIIP